MTQQQEQGVFFMLLTMLIYNSNTLSLNPDLIAVKTEECTTTGFMATSVCIYTEKHFLQHNTVVKDYYSQSLC